MVDYRTNFSASQKLLAFHENQDIIYLERLRERDGKKRERERERERLRYWWCATTKLSTSKLIKSLDNQSKLSNKQ